MANKSQWVLSEYLAEEGKLIITMNGFDIDSFPVLGEQLLASLSATVVEKQLDADLHSWLIDFEGCRLLLKAEHYSESVWFEALSVSEGREELDFLARLFRSGV